MRFLWERVDSQACIILLMMFWKWQEQREGKQARGHQGLGWQA